MFKSITDLSPRSSVQLCRLYIAALSEGLDVPIINMCGKQEWYISIKNINKEYKRRFYGF